MLRTAALLLCLLSWLSVSSQTVGWFYSEAGAAGGYLLFAPMGSDTTYLIDKCGRRVHEWGSSYNPGAAVYLLNDGSLLRCGDAENIQFNTGGRGGIIEKIDWEGNVTWSYKISSDSLCQHHDAILLPNGNILAIVWEKFTMDEAIANGRDPSAVGNKVWSDKIIEIKPVGDDSAIIVWEWRAWNHLVQDFDSAKPNYGIIHDHPELININRGNLSNTLYDWLHCNGLDYNEALDQIMISCNHLGEIWIIDHSTTMEEAASHSGGLSSKGGDLLYRWGNPETYGRGSTDDRRFYGQHNPQWIREGLPGEGNILVYSNGNNQPGGNFSSVITLELPEVTDNNYYLEPGEAYGPLAANWVYMADDPGDFFSAAVSGAQRLANGNTVICEGMSGTFFEVNEDGEELWQYINPVSNGGIVSQGTAPFLNSVFRCIYLSGFEEGLTGRDLTPGGPIELNPLPYACINVVGTEEVAMAYPAIRIFPNPASEKFFVSANADLSRVELRIFDAVGRLFFSSAYSSVRAGETLEAILPEAAGLYRVILTADDSKVFISSILSE
jgi:hypothetical protein